MQRNELNKDVDIPIKNHHLSEQTELDVFDQLSYAIFQETEHEQVNEETETSDKICFTSYLGNAMGLDNPQVATASHLSEKS